MEAKPCRMCGSTKLRALFFSDTDEKWVGCDECGNVSQPVVSNHREEIIAQWNKEQAQDHFGGND
jgi:uncharacterized Zn finger protein